MEITGAAKDDRTTGATVSTFIALNSLADFDADVPTITTVVGEGSRSSVPKAEGSVKEKEEHVSVSSNIDFKVGYTINLNLPETTDPEVFNAIFKSLKENLLSD